MNINTVGTNQQAQPSRQEQGLRLLIPNLKDQLATLEARRTQLLQELREVNDEIGITRAQIDQAENLIRHPDERD